MPDFSTEIDIDAWDYISACSNREVKELIEALIEQGHLDSFKVNNPQNNLFGDEWWESLVKLRDSRHLLSNDEETLIRNIANRF